MSSRNRHSPFQLRNKPPKATILSQHNPKQPTETDQNKRKIAKIVGGAAGAFALIIGLIPGASQVAGVTNMILAYSMLFLAWAIGFIGVSWSGTVLAKSRNKILVSILSAIIFGAIFGGYGFWLAKEKAEIERQIIEKEIRQYLLPRNQSPKQETDGYTFLLGDLCFILTENSQSTLIKGDDTNLISAKVVNDQLYMSANIFEGDGRKVVEIKENDQLANTSAEYKITNPDSSTLEVRNNEGKLMLHIFYENPRLIKIIGDFYSPNKKRVEITPEKVIYRDRAMMTGGCFFLAEKGVGVSLN